MKGVGILRRRAVRTVPNRSHNAYFYKLLDPVDFLLDERIESGIRRSSDTGARVDGGRSKTSTSDSGGSTLILINEVSRLNVEGVEDVADGLDRLFQIHHLSLVREYPITRSSIPATAKSLMRNAESRLEMKGVRLREASDEGAVIS